jgi:hypothetical protein
MNKNKDSIQFLNTTLKASTLYSAKVLSQNDSKLVDLVLHGARKKLFSSLQILESCNLCNQLF